MRLSVDFQCLVLFWSDSPQKCALKVNFGAFICIRKWMYTLKVTMMALRLFNLTARSPLHPTTLKTTSHHRPISPSHPTVNPMDPELALGLEAGSERSLWTHKLRRCDPLLRCRSHGEPASHPLFHSLSSSSPSLTRCRFVSVLHASCFGSVWVFPRVLGGESGFSITALNGVGLLCLNIRPVIFWCFSLLNVLDWVLEQSFRIRVYA